MTLWPHSQNGVMGVGSRVKCSNAHPVPTQAPCMSKGVSVQLVVGGMMANGRIYVLPKGTVTSFQLSIIAALLKCKSGGARPFNFSRKDRNLDFCINCKNEYMLTSSNLKNKRSLNGTKKAKQSRLWWTLVQGSPVCKLCLC